MNPFKEKAQSPESYLNSFKDISPKAYDKNQTDPYTKTRIILAAGSEWEANWFSHQMHRNISNTDLRRDIALTRFIEKQQQQKIVNLKPIDETVLETTITNKDGVVVTPDAYGYITESGEYLARVKVEENGIIKFYEIKFKV